MGKLTINELSKSLLGYLQPKQDDTLNTEDKTITGAINELEQEINNLFQSANNGKQLIANAIGRPLDASDTFGAMSTDITSYIKNELKKTLTDEGVTVNSTDDFLALIEKVDEEFARKNNTITDLSNGASGMVKPAGTAIASDVLSGRTFINYTGNTITGTMTHQGSKTITPTINTQTFPAGYYSGITVNGSTPQYKTGSQSITVSTSTTSININFGTTLTKVPTFVCVTGHLSARSDINYSFETGNTGYLSTTTWYTELYITNITTTGCTLKFTHSGTSTTYGSIQWIAIL